MINIKVYIHEKVSRFDKNRTTAIRTSSQSIEKHTKHSILTVVHTDHSNLNTLYAHAHTHTYYILQHISTHTPPTRQKTLATKCINSNICPHTRHTHTSYMLYEICALTINLCNKKTLENRTEHVMFFSFIFLLW